MSIDTHDDRESFPPPWFRNEDDPEPVVEGSNFWRSVIGIGAFVVVLLLLLIPVLQAEVLQQRRDALPDEEMERTALLFASAMLFGRSEGQAMLFSEDRADGDVRDTLGRVLDTPLPSRRARLQVISAPCSREQADACFQGRIFDPSAPNGPPIRFGIDDTDDGPKVIWVEIDEIIVRAPPLSGRELGTFVTRSTGSRDVPFEAEEPGTFGHPQTRAAVAR